jgi:phage tail-like protein
MAEEKRAILRLVGPEIVDDTVIVTEKGLKVGRLAANDLPLRHQKISRFHAEFHLTGRGLTVTDLGSSNGTQIGEETIEPDVPRLLNIGESVRFGPFVLTLEQIVDTSTATPPPSPTPIQPVAVPDTAQPEKTRAVSADQVREVVEAEAKRLQEEQARQQHEEAEAAESTVDRPEALEKAEVPPVPLPPAEPGPAPLEELPIAAEGDLPPPQEAHYITAFGPQGPSQPFKPPAPPDIPPRVPITATPQDSHPEHIHGIPRYASNWLAYLPAIYSEDEFTARFLLIFESLNAPLEWLLDHFYMFLMAKYAPPEWLQWFGSWADILVPTSIEESRQREIVAELGTLFRSRGTPRSLRRHLELVFASQPDIREPQNQPSSFEVVLKLGKTGDTEANRKLAERIIEAHRPAHTHYTLTIK